jgi:hypothetical protein
MCAATGGERATILLIMPISFLILNYPHYPALPRSPPDASEAVVEPWEQRASPEIKGMDGAAAIQALGSFGGYLRKGSPSNYGRQKIFPLNFEVVRSTTSFNLKIMAL